MTLADKFNYDQGGYACHWNCTETEQATRRIWKTRMGYLGVIVDDYHSFIRQSKQGFKRTEMQDNVRDLSTWAWRLKRLSN